MDPQPLIQTLASTDGRLGAMRDLLGGITAAELRHAVVPDEVLEALIDGLADPNAKIRWWCVQLLDHLSDQRAVLAIAQALHDPVPRVRRNAAHALGCTACKPTWGGKLPPDIATTLNTMATNDSNAKVRAQAKLALSCQHP